jgi:hypothetical protein
VKQEGIRLRVSIKMRAHHVEDWRIAVDGSLLLAPVKSLLSANAIGLPVAVTNTLYFYEVLTLKGQGPAEFGRAFTKSFGPIKWRQGRAA